MVVLQVEASGHVAIPALLQLPVRHERRPLPHRRSRQSVGERRNHVELQRRRCVGPEKRDLETPLCNVHSSARSRGGIPRQVNLTVTKRSPSPIINHFRSSGTQILIIGGVTTAYLRALTDTECFCCERRTWVKGLANLPVPLSGHSAVTLPPASLI